MIADIFQEIDQKMQINKAVYTISVKLYGQYYESYDL
jgi:hypothetical protein